MNEGEALCFQQHHEDPMEDDRDRMQDERVARPLADPADGHAQADRVPAADKDRQGGVEGVAQVRLPFRGAARAERPVSRQSDEGQPKQDDPPDNGQGRRVRQEEERPAERPDRQPREDGRPR